MPIFEYKCNDCDKVFEILQLPGINSDLKCAACGGASLRKLISAPFLPSSVGKPANDSTACANCETPPGCPGAGGCPGAVGCGGNPS